MSARRSGRLPALTSPLTLLDQVAPIHRALCAEMAELTIGGAHYGAVARAVEALAQLAADLGHPGRFAEMAPRSNMG
ncbi:hypothetical protein [Lichenibacterium dinghuense]|uniref:hypothetical protein n=1 Tax=Lichenibacterium dinghuense TaxID=2895977 RepID=UPI001F41DD44|nr:hypothetical protein [Lichenibacterium sp. 6Y81]